MAATLPLPHLAPGDPLELRVDRGKQRIDRRAIAFARPHQQLGEVCSLHRAPGFSRRNEPITGPRPGL